MLRTPSPSCLLLACWLAALVAAPIPAQTPATGEPLTEPQEIDVETDPLTMLYVQFAEVEIPLSPTKSQTIWTRAYGLEPTADLIPGPSFVFHPGDFLQITINNLLDDQDPRLQDFETEVDPVYDTDEIAHHVRGEINLPHNANNTNLHTHGLHVDPSHDDVTLILIPKGDDKTNYDASLWPFIREQIWPYQYRIPKSHLPGTHWYHAHKHGSTSVHVENGMAGALIIRPEDPADDVIPNLSADHDRVLMLQEIANYGVQQGVGKGLTDLDVDTGGAAAVDPNTKPKNPQKQPMITVNGQVQPSLDLKPGQVERWRFINAAANHRSFSYLWVGRKTDCPAPEGTEGQDAKPKTSYVQVPMHLVALDGITLKASVPVTAERPLFLGPGNRADVAVQFDETGTYGLFKNFPSDVQVVTSDCQVITPAAETDQISNPYLLGQESTSDPNFAGFQQPWVILDVSTGQPSSVQEDTAIVPKLAVEPRGSGASRLLDLTYPTHFEVGAVGWQPIATGDLGGGATDSQRMIEINVQGDPVDSPGLPSDSHLASISPTGTMTPPAYVSPIETADILQSRTALFDLSGVTVLVEPEDQSSEAQRIKQFTLNGRQFDLDDSIGNTDAVELINKAPQVPPAASSGSQDLSLDCVEPHGLYRNQHWTNPGYYRKITQTTVDGAQGFTYESDDVAKASGSQTCFPAQGEAVKLSYADVTGIDQVSVVNPEYAGRDRVAGIPGLPVATTAEEWVLINNSPIGHPFHIHINPFFITEVGQLSYEGFKGSKECGGSPSDPHADMAWVLRTVNPDPNGPPDDACSMDAPTGPEKLQGTNTMSWVVNNWWDTIVIPPHGYVKMRYWMNVPQQTLGGSEVFDNVNRSGSWVYHCHILRHEDRGMMMVVGTQPKRAKGAD